MPDRLSPDERRALMGRIRSTDTAPEISVRRLLHGLGYRYVLHDKRLPGTPDLVFPSRGCVVMVHGCFWHCHGCGRGFVPAENRTYWKTKLDANRRRDRRKEQALRRLGWRVMTVWECTVAATRRDALMRRLVSFLGPSTRTLDVTSVRTPRGPHAL
jgi:DNA mismatch endonuclease (patch repair protein)